MLIYLFVYLLPLSITFLNSPVTSRKYLGERASFDNHLTLYSPRFASELYVVLSPFITPFLCSKPVENIFFTCFSPSFPLSLPSLFSPPLLPFSVFISLAFSHPRLLLFPFFVSSHISFCFSPFIFTLSFPFLLSHLLIFPFLNFYFLLLFPFYFFSSSSLSLNEGREERKNFNLRRGRERQWKIE